MLILQNPHHESVSDVVEPWVRGILHRSDPLENELPHAIILVRQGGTYLSPGISRLRDSHNDKSFEITPRALDILRLTAKGYLAKEISVQIELCNKSIYRVLRTLRENHGVENNFQLFLIAQQLGLLSADDLE